MDQTPGQRNVLLITPGHDDRPRGPKQQASADAFRGASWTPSKTSSRTGRRDLVDKGLCAAGRGCWVCALTRSNGKGFTTDASSRKVEVWRCSCDRLGLAHRNLGESFPARQELHCHHHDQIWASPPGRLVADSRSWKGRGSHAEKDPARDPVTRLMGPISEILCCYSTESSSLASR
jgi:hypothetical protein